jgi:hypothetical protein
MDALKTLIEKIRDMMPIDELIKDPARTPVVGTRDLLIIKNAIITSQVGSQGKKVTEVILDAKEVVQRLRSISVNPQKAKSKDIQQMRQFCLSLSEAASAGQPSPFKDRNRYFGRR